MTTIVTRVYADEKQARAAMNALKAEFVDERISMAKQTAGAYAGKYAVSVRAEWGFATSAMAILDAHKPIGGGETTEKPSNGRTSTAFSGFFDFPELMEIKSWVVLSHEPAPFSKLLNQPVLSDMKPKAELLDEAAPLSARMNFPTISRSKPFSGLINDKSNTVLIP
jgi:hypothetical protein